jgi:hypothetical protein
VTNDSESTESFYLLQQHSLVAFVSNSSSTASAHVVIFPPNSSNISANTSDRNEATASIASFGYGHSGSTSTAMTSNANPNLRRRRYRYRYSTHHTSQQFHSPFVPWSQSSLGSGMASVTTAAAGANTYPTLASVGGSSDAKAQTSSELHDIGTMYVFHLHCSLLYWI